MNPEALVRKAIALHLAFPIFERNRNGGENNLGYWWDRIIASSNAAGDHVADHTLVAHWFAIVRDRVIQNPLATPSASALWRELRLVA